MVGLVRQGPVVGRPLAGFGLAALLVLIAAAIRLTLQPMFGSEAPLLIFVFPTVAVALLAGTAPAVFATVFSLALGSYLFIEPIGDIWGVPDRADQGRILVFVGGSSAIILLVHSLTATRAALAVTGEQAERSARLLNAIVETTPHAIVATDLEGRVTAWNAAASRIFGWSAHEVLGSPLPYIPETELAEFTRQRGRALRGEPIGNRVVRRQRRDGTSIPCRIWVTPLRDRADRVQGLLATLEDVTQQQQLEAQFRHAQKMEAIGELAAGIAHDFNNQLTLVRGYSELALNELPESHPVQQYIQEIERAGMAASVLTRQLLTFSRRQPVDLQPTDVVSVIRMSEQMLRRAVRDDVRMHIALPDEPLWIVADSTQLEHILLNLTINAQDAMPHGGKLSIDATVVHLDEAHAGAHLDISPGEHVLLTISDTGAGIPREMQARIFEPFFTTKEPGKGTGLGLAMVYGSVRQMNGSIWVYSEPGQGTTFKLYFPRVRPDREVRPAAPRAGLAAGNETVLVVDDDEHVRGLVVRALEKGGYRVLSAALPADALTVAHQHTGPIHLLITDVIMPQMHGPLLASVLAAETGLKRVLYTSGYADHPEIADQLARGDAYFLQKPFTPADLTVAARRAFDGDVTSDT